jgi:hypothetical protein
MTRCQTCDEPGKEPNGEKTSCGKKIALKMSNPKSFLSKCILYPLSLIWCPNSLISVTSPRLTEGATVSTNERYAMIYWICRDKILIKMMYILLEYWFVHVERIMSAFSVACASGKYKPKGKTTCTACETGTEPNPAKTACGKRVLEVKSNAPVKFLMKL